MHFFFFWHAILVGGMKCRGNTIFPSYYNGSIQCRRHYFIKHRNMEIIFGTQQWHQNLLLLALAIHTLTKKNWIVYTLVDVSFREDLNALTNLHLLGQSKHVCIHIHAQCSHTSVELIQARPNIHLLLEPICCISGFTKQALTLYSCSYVFVLSLLLTPFKHRSSFQCEAIPYLSLCGSKWQTLVAHLLAVSFVWIVDIADHYLIKSSYLIVWFIIGFYPPLFSFQIIS